MAVTWRNLMLQFVVGQGSLVRCLEAVETVEAVERLGGGVHNERTTFSLEKILALARKDSLLAAHLEAVGRTHRAHHVLECGLVFGPVLGVCAWR